MHRSWKGGGGANNIQGQQRVKSDNVGTENTGCLRYSSLSTDNHNPGERVWSPETTTLNLTRHFSGTQALPSHFLDKDTESKFPLSFHLDL